MLPVKGGTKLDVQVFLPEAARDNRFRVLVVDDDPGFCRMLCRRLQIQGYTAFQLLDGLQTLPAIDDKKPDLVVLDARLGKGIDGFEICEKIKARDATRRLPVIMISGVIKEQEEQERAMRLGAADYLTKPFTAEALGSAVGAALERAGQEKAGVPRLDGTIVVIDDDVSWLNLTLGWLKSAGATAIGSVNERDAVELALRHKPDCIVLDYQLQTKTAHELCRELKAYQPLQKIPVIVHSVRQSQKLQSLVEGADHFVLKSSTGDELVVVALACVRRRRAGSLVNGDLRLESSGYEVYRDDRMIAKLTEEQFQFLSALVERSPKPVSRPELLKRLSRQGIDDDTSKALAKLAERIREKLGQRVGRRIRSGKEFGWVYDPNAPLG